MPFEGTRNSFFFFFFTFCSVFCNPTLVSHSLIPPFLLGGRSSQKQIRGLCMESLLESSSMLCISNLAEPFIALISQSGDACFGLHPLHFPSFQLLINPSLLNKAEQKGACRQPQRLPGPLWDPAHLLTAGSYQVDFSRRTQPHSLLGLGDVPHLTIQHQPSWPPSSLTRGTTRSPPLLWPILVLPIAFLTRAQLELALAVNFHCSSPKYSNRHLAFSPWETSLHICTDTAVSLLITSFTMMLKRQKKWKAPNLTTVKLVTNDCHIDRHSLLVSIPLSLSQRYKVGLRAVWNHLPVLRLHGTSSCGSWSSLPRAALLAETEERVCRRVGRW